MGPLPNEERDVFFSYIFCSVRLRQRCNHLVDLSGGAKEGCRNFGDFFGNQGSFKWDPVFLMQQIHYFKCDLEGVSSFFLVHRFFGWFRI